MARKSTGPGHKVYQIVNKHPEFETEEAKEEHSENVMRRLGRAWYYHLNSLDNQGRKNAAE